MTTTLLGAFPSDTVLIPKDFSKLTNAFSMRFTRSKYVCRGGGNKVEKVYLKRGLRFSFPRRSEAQHTLRGGLWVSCWVGWLS